MQSTWRLCFRKPAIDGVTKEQARRLAKFLNRCQVVFSRNDQDMKNTDLIRHCIPVQKETCLIKQHPLPTLPPPSPYRLAPQKEQKAKRQIPELLVRRMIEPASGAWSSPVVLVRKKRSILAFLCRLSEVKCRYSARCVRTASHR